MKYPVRTALWLALLVFVAAVFLAVPALADGVGYIDADGEAQTCNEYSAVTNAVTEWEEGWYAVTEDTLISTRIAVNGDVHLILCDGATLTAPKGIGVTSGNALTIYGQSGHTGALSITAPEGWNAGIGSNQDIAEAGAITINGGVITATGAEYDNDTGYGGSAGIGGKSFTVTIDGGTVTGGRAGSAGIGGGDGARMGSNTNASSGSVSIADTVTHLTATMGSEGVASIGSGRNSTPGGVLLIGGNPVSEITESPFTYPPYSYTVRFDANGGTGDTMADQSFLHGFAQNLTANTYTRNHYKFLGWATSSSGEVEYADE